MKSNIILLLIGILISSFCYGAEVMPDFKDKTLPSLNEEIRKNQKTTEKITNTTTSLDTRIDVLEAAAAPVPVALGAWESKSDNTVYQAATDGFVSAYAGSGGYTGYTDGANPPTTQRITNYGGAINGGIFMPVKKNDYWKAVGTGSGKTVYWIPLS